ncbi:MAG TPA: hypothetical protein VG167_18905 [Verrucomicrobiae bacterium]|nr:hypothetical protein [Verrucomicrobiae bacterium]
MVSFADKAEANLTAETELKTAKARVTELEGQAAKDKTTITTHEATIQDLHGKVTAKDDEIAKLTTDLAAEKNRTNNTLAAQGVSAEQLPAAETGNSPGAGKESAWGIYERLAAKDPVAAGQFYFENADAVLKSRPRS